MKIKGKNILFCVSSLGLGHATRELPIIYHYVNDNKIFVISAGNSLSLLKQELKSKNAKFFELKDYPNLERGEGFSFYLYMIHDLTKVNIMIRKEHKFVEEIVQKHKIDLVFSDMRYGCYSTKVPSFGIAHQISFSIKKEISFLQNFVDNFNKMSFNKFTKLLIPDFKGKHSLAGDLSHPKILSKVDHEYIGLLSSVPHIKKKKDIDYLFVISGFLKEHIKIFINRLIDEAKFLKGKKVFILGDPTRNEHKKLPNNIEVYSFAPIKLRNDLMNRAKIVVSRSGYTTVLDLIELDLTGILVPTPNQSEQEYLADFLGKKKYFLTFKDQDSFTLKGIQKKLKNIKKYENKSKTAQSLEKIDKIVGECL